MGRRNPQKFLASHCMPLTPEGWTLLKTWEGCRLSAYPDPASGGAPWTIGYGHTGADVGPDLTITQHQADAFLQKDVAHAASAVERLLPGVALLPRQHDALISFCFNVGVGALETSTLRKRLLAGESVPLVLREELPRWCKGPHGPVEGLKRRRAAEVAHATAAEQAKATPTTQQGGDPTGCALSEPERQRHWPGQPDVFCLHLRYGGGLPQARLHQGLRSAG